MRVYQFDLILDNSEGTLWEKNDFSISFIPLFQ